MLEFEMNKKLFSMGANFNLLSLFYSYFLLKKVFF